MSKRIFIAIKPTDTNLSQLISIQQLLENLTNIIPKNKCRWISPTNIHMTTHFIGVVEDHKIKLIRNLLRDVSNEKKHSQYLEEPVLFPKPTNVRVIGIGSSITTEELQKMYNKITHIIESLRLRTEKRPFYPHITLARSSSGFSIDKDILRKELEKFWLKFEISNLCLYESKLERTGARYEIIEKFELAD